MGFRWMVLAAAAAVAATAVGSVGYVQRRFKRRLSREVAELLSASTNNQPAMITEVDLKVLPAPVQRWLRFSGVTGTRCPSTVQVTQEGQFRLAEGGRWMPFTAVEHFTTDPPGFVWSVDMKLAPFLSISGRDRYADGRASIDMRLLGVIPVARASGSQLDQGALLRYLNEIMWFPAAALQPYISWRQVDATSAEATMNYAGVSATATLIFDNQGRLIDMLAERYNTATDQLETWSTPILGYGEFNGVIVPTEGEGVWELNSGDFKYIQLWIESIQYNTALGGSPDATGQNLS